MTHDSLTPRIERLRELGVAADRAEGSNFFTTQQAFLDALDKDALTVIDALVAENTGLRRLLELAKTGLRFYSSRDNYDYEGRVILNPSHPRYIPPMVDAGQTARDALVELSMSLKEEP